MERHAEAIASADLGPREPLPDPEKGDIIRYVEVHAQWWAHASLSRS